MKYKKSLIVFVGVLVILFLAVYLIRQSNTMTRAYRCEEGYEIFTDKTNISISDDGKMGKIGYKRKFIGDYEIKSGNVGDDYITKVKFEDNSVTLTSPEGTVRACKLERSEPNTKRNEVVADILKAIIVNLEDKIEHFRKYPETMQEYESKDGGLGNDIDVLNASIERIKASIDSIYIH